MSTYFVFEDSKGKVSRLRNAITIAGHQFRWVDEVGTLHDESVKLRCQAEYPSDEQNSFYSAIAKYASSTDAIFMVDMALNESERKISEQRSFKAITAAKIVAKLKERNPNARIFIISTISRMGINLAWKESLSLIRHLLDDGSISFKMPKNPTVRSDWKPEDFV